MRLVLLRKYTPKLTLGRLLLGEKQLCFTQEPPKLCFGGSASCLVEGVFELDPIHSEVKGWEIGIGEIGKISRFPALGNFDANSIYPITSYRADGTPMFTRLAFLKLMDLLEHQWNKEEIIELQVISEPISYQLESCLVRSYC